MGGREVRLEAALRIYIGYADFLLAFHEFFLNES
jgi:hypothetical protein